MVRRFTIRCNAKLLTLKMIVTWIYNAIMLDRAQEAEEINRKQREVVRASPVHVWLVPHHILTLTSCSSNIEPSVRIPIGG